MTKSESIFIGYTNRKFSYKGEILIKTEYPNSNDFSKINALLIEIDSALIPFQITKIKPHAQNQIRVKLLGVDHENDAQKLLHKRTYVSKNSLDLNFEPLNDINYLIGYQVFDETIEIGTIKNIINRPIQPLLEVLSNGNEFLIPIDEELVLYEDQKNQKVIMKLPKGLMDLNK